MDRFLFGYWDTVDIVQPTGVPAYVGIVELVGISV